jgi:glutamate formiminotransferase
VLPLESVPNVSEGRDAGSIGAIGEAFGSRARLLDVHSDVDHHRSVYTLVGSEGDDALIETVVAGIAEACERIDLRRHVGVHPRVGAADVVPLVPIVPADMPRASAAALRVGELVAERLGIPVFLYGEVGDGRRPAFFRRGGPAELQRRIESGELAPDFGPAELNERSGAVLVGARRPLIAFNAVLALDDEDVARAVAAAVRESSGGLPGVQAIGLRLASSGKAQVSMNIVDTSRAELHEVVQAVVAEAAARGTIVESTELVGLLPAGAVVAAAATPLLLASLDASRVLELRLLETSVE